MSAAGLQNQLCGGGGSLLYIAMSVLLFCSSLSEFSRSNCLKPSKMLSCSFCIVLNMLMISSTVAV